MHLSEILDIEKLNRHINDGDIKIRLHKTEPLIIYNYSAKCQFDKIWTHETMTCRGLIVHADTLEVLAKPFTKFFNLGERPEHATLDWSKPHSIYEKLDGSLGIAYCRPSDGKTCVATRGAFHSPQAEHATEWLHRTHPEWVPHPAVTALFEIIYDGSRVVVDYGTMDEMVLLTEISLNGMEGPIVGLHKWPGKVVTQFEGGYEGMLTAQKTEKGSKMEGFVVHFYDGLRVKVKTEDYSRLHRLVCGLSKRAIWEVLAYGDSLDEFLAVVPDEFYVWVKQVAAELTLQANDVEAVCSLIVADAKFADGGNDRKRVAQGITERAARSKYPEVAAGICFLMLDGKDGRLLRPDEKGPKGWRALVWKAVYPEHATFRTVDEATS